MACHTATKTNLTKRKYNERKTSLLVEMLKYISIPTCKIYTGQLFYVTSTLEILYHILFLFVHVYFTMPNKPH